MKFLNKLENIWRKLTGKPELRDIWKFDPTIPGPPGWEKLNANLPTDSLFLFGCKLLGWIKVNEYKKSNLLQSITIDNILNLDPEYVKKTCCMNLVIEEHTGGKVIDFYGVKGREIPLSEVIRLETTYFSHDVQYNSLLREWKKFSLEEKKEMLEIFLCPRNKKSLPFVSGVKIPSRGRFILPLLPQEYTYRFLYEVSLIGSGLPKTVLRYFKDPVYLNCFNKRSLARKTGWISKSKTELDNFNKVFLNLVKLGWVYVPINLYFLIDISVSSLRKLLKHQSPKCRENQRRCFKAWIDNNLSYKFWGEEIINSSKNLHLREKILLLFKYTRLHKIDPKYKNYYSFLQESYKSSYYSNMREINKRIEKYDWFSDKILGKLISYSREGFLLKYPLVLLKNLKKDNSSIFDALTVLHEVVTKVIKSKDGREKLNSILCMKWLRIYFDPELQNPSSPNWENIESYIKEYIYSCIYEQSNRLNVNSEGCTDASNSSLFWEKVSINSPIFSKVIPFVGKDFNIATVEGQLKEEYPVITKVSRPNKEIVLTVFSDNILEPTVIEGDIVFPSILDGNEWYFIGVDSTEWVLDNLTSNVRIDDREKTVTYNNKLVHMGNSMTDGINNLQFGERWSKILAVYHSPSKTIFSGFRSKDDKYLLFTTQEGENNSSKIKKIISYLSPLTDISDYIITRPHE